MYLVSTIISNHIFSHQLSFFFKIFYNGIFTLKFMSLYFDMKQIQKMFEAYHVEGEWLHKTYVPPILEYMEMGLNRAGCYAHLMAESAGVDEEIADVNVFEWIPSDVDQIALDSMKSLDC